MIGPRLTPKEYFGEREPEIWFHLVVSDPGRSMQAFDQFGKKLWSIPALARGQNPNWKVRRGDTPPGLYKVGQIWNDVAEQGLNPEFRLELMQYGWISFDLIDLENQESGNGRSGILIHGGGSACGWPDAWGQLQSLYPTHGCIRVHNQDLRDKILPLTQRGVVLVSVYQDA